MPESPAPEAGSSKLAFERLQLGWKDIRAAFQAPASLEEQSVPEIMSTSEAAASSTGTSWAAWAERARKLVVEKVSYDAVPQGDASPSEDFDEEKGEAVNQWASWAMAAADRVKQQVSAAAEEAGNGFAQAAEKAKAGDWAEQVAKGLGKVAENASQASAALAEKGKVATQLAKDLGGKSQQKLVEAKAIGAAKAQKAKEKAAAAAGAAKTKLAQAGQSISGLTALTLSPMKLAQFAGVFMVGILLISMSFSFLPILVIAPQKFALLFAFGSMTMLGSFAILKGPQAFLSGLAQPAQLPFSAAYAVGLVGTLVATLLLRSYLLTSFFALVQAVALLYFLASYVPGGKAVLNGCGRLCNKAARALLCNGA